MISHQRFFLLVQEIVFGSLDFSQGIFALAVRVDGSAVRNIKFDFACASRWMRSHLSTRRASVIGLSGWKTVLMFVS